MSFWLPCCFLNFKSSLIIIQRATFSNQYTSLRKLHLHSRLCGLLMAVLLAFLFPHSHSMYRSTNLNVVLKHQEWRGLTLMAILYWCVTCLGIHLPLHKRSHSYLDMKSIYLCNRPKLCPFTSILHRPQLLRNRHVTLTGVDFINYVIFTFLKVINTIKNRVLIHYLLLIKYAIFVKTMYDKMHYS